MGWGNPPHEGFEARVLVDGRERGVWSAETNAQSTGRTVVMCSCGWRGGQYKDWGHNAEGQRWWPDLDVSAEDEAVYQDWWTHHMAPMVEPDPRRLLVLGRDAGGARHFLAGEPVHAGTSLELRLLDDVWVRVRYESRDYPNLRAVAYLALGGRGEDLGYMAAPVSFNLPAEAELRWPR